MSSAAEPSPSFSSIRAPDRVGRGRPRRGLPSSVPTVCAVPPAPSVALSGGLAGPGPSTPVALVRPEVAALIRADHPGLPDEASIGLADLHRYRMAHIEAVLAAARGELTVLDHEVLDSIRTGDVLSENVGTAGEAQETRGERLADGVATFGGSWTFIVSFFAVLAGWVALNAVVLAGRPFDPYPFILLNLVLSCLASIQAPVILMSQNRKGTKDRARAEHDYQVNLKAELEIRLLHEKLDHLLLHGWQNLVETQRVQAELLDEVVCRLDLLLGDKATPDVGVEARAGLENDDVGDD
jgi:uncharacterized membrane protein